MDRRENGREEKGEKEKETSPKTLLALIFVFHRYMLAVRIHLILLILILFVLNSPFSRKRRKKAISIHPRDVKKCLPYAPIPLTLFSHVENKRRKKMHM